MRKAGCSREGLNGSGSKWKGDEAGGMLPRGFGLEYARLGSTAQHTLCGSSGDKR